MPYKTSNNNDFPAHLDALARLAPLAHLIPVAEIFASLAGPTANVQIPCSTVIPEAFP